MLTVDQQQVPLGITLYKLVVQNSKQYALVIILMCIQELAGYMSDHPMSCLDEMARGIAIF
jgi:hypothetical protein